MNKLGKREYIQLVAEVLTNEYGGTLKEYGTDVQMAEAVINELTEFLFFHPLDIEDEEWEEWKKNRDPLGKL